MAHATFRAEVLTPEGQVFDEEVEMVSTRTETGSIGILAGHQPLLGLLAPAELRLTRPGGEVVRMAQGEGYVQVAKEGVLLLVEDAVKPEDLDAAALQERVRKAQADLSAAEPGSEAAAVARREQRRWEVFLRVAGG